jgi:hypothetical protein
MLCLSLASVALPWRSFFCLIGVCFLSALAEATPMAEPDTSTAEYLVAVESSTDVAAEIAALGATVRQRDASHNLLFVRMSPSLLTELKQLSGVKQVSPALRVTVELDGSDEAGKVPARISELGGFVAQSYVATPLLAVVIPAGRIQQLRSLPGVRRVRKPRLVKPMNRPLLQSPSHKAQTTS